MCAATPGLSIVLQYQAATILLLTAEGLPSLLRIRGNSALRKPKSSLILLSSCISWDAACSKGSQFPSEILLFFGRELAQ